MGVHGAVAKRPCSRQHLLLLVVAILIGSYFAAAAAAAADEQKSRNRGAGRRSRRRRAAAAVTSPPAPLMVPITILESAVDLGAGMIIMLSAMFAGVLLITVCTYYLLGGSVHGRNTACLPPAPGLRSREQQLDRQPGGDELLPAIVLPPPECMHQPVIDA
jgi:hypothetical protein